MSSETGKITLTEAVAVLHDPDALQAAVDDLLTHGFDQADISLLAGAHTIEKKLGHAYEKVQELEDDADVPRTAYVSTDSLGEAEGGVIGGLIYVGAVAATGAMVASGGTLAGVLVAAAMAGGAGGLIGSVLAGLIEDRHARYLQEQVDHGGLLLWVRTRDRAHEETAQEVLRAHAGEDVHLHELSAHVPQWEPH